MLEGVGQVLTGGAELGEVTGKEKVESRSETGKGKEPSIEVRSSMGKRN